MYAMLKKSSLIACR